MTRGKRNDQPCLVDGCATRAWGRGMCQKHYTRNRRYGNTNDPVTLTIEERLDRLIDRDGPTTLVGLGPCWIWTGSLGKNDYGSFTPNGGGVSVSAYKFVYERERGAVPDGLQLDHLCRNIKCVNPDHLEAVTCRVNVLRGVGAPAQNARKTHCKRGHEFNEQNTYYMDGGRRRGCKPCRRLRRVS